MLDLKKKKVKFFQQWDYIFHVNPIIHTSLKLCTMIRQIIVIPTV